MRQGRAALHSDHLLTARAATDADQNLIWRWHSDAFGVGEAESLTSASHPEAQSLTLNLRFPGQYHDQESGLYYNYFRTYDPSKGRYTQSDPIGLMGGVNTFAYVSGNPLLAMDSFGLRALTVGEIELAKTIFGDKIDYSTVDIYRERFAGVIPVPAQRAMAPNGNIYFHPNNRYYSDDFSGASMDLKGLFIHEMTHVWQHQSGVNLWVRGAFEREYGYEINCNSTLSGYGIEAQGNIVMDYFFTLHGYKTASWGSQTFEGVYGLEDYKSVLSGYF